MMRKNGIAAGLAAFAAALVTFSAGTCAADEFDNLTHRVDDEKAPAVLMTRDVSSEGLVKIYEALGRAPRGKVGIKITFESPGGPYLPPELLRGLAEKTNGTFIDSNALSARRGNAEEHRALAAEHGFTAVAPVDILDAEGEIDMPVTNGKRLKFHRTGSHFDDYDSVISVVRFKPHHIQKYGGTLKNMTICLASPSGKCNIHSAGETAEYYSPAPLDIQLESFADAVKAALDYKKDAWVFINVLCATEPDDDCEGTKPFGDLCILASLDPVAVDQAAIDITFGMAGTEELRRAWEDYHETSLTEYAEAAGAGSNEYRLVPID